MSDSMFNKYGNLLPEFIREIRGVVDHDALNILFNKAPNVVEKRALAEYLVGEVMGLSAENILRGQMERRKKERDELEKIRAARFAAAREKLAEKENEDVS